MTRTTEACPWDLMDILQVFALYFFMVLLGSTGLITLVRKVLGVDPVALLGTNAVVLILSLMTNVFSCLFVFFIVSFRYRQPVSALGLSLMSWKGNLFQGFLRYLVAFPIIMSVGFLVEFVSSSLGMMPQSQEVVLRVMEETSFVVLGTMVFLGAVAGPMAEEILFRGFLQPALRDMLGKSWAILLSAFFFSLVHLNLYIFLQIFILGLLLGYLFEKTGTLVAPIAIHMLHNSMVLTFVLWFKQKGGFLG
jgi:membrane protease YdiL (CAAX protease family)